MSLDNPFATFLGKRCAVAGGFKRCRSETNVSQVEETTTATVFGVDAASSTASPNAAEFGKTNRSFPTAGTSTSPVKVFLLSDDGEDEEAELRLLLGSGGDKVFVRPHEEAVTATAARESTAAECTLGERKADTVVDTSAAVAFNKLPWETRSNTVLAELAERFEAQFCYELRQNAELVRVFEPFLSNKALRRIEADTWGPQFFAAPVLTADETNTAEGHTLRSYQLEGVQFLLRCFHGGMSCILADDMGLGKTAQIACFLNMLKMKHGISGPHLVVVPLSTLSGWMRELTRWAPTLRVVKYHGERKGRMSLRASRGNRHCVFLTTPSVLSQDRGFFRKRAWVVTVIDEAHVLKGNNTIITSVARKLTACFRLAVTGTPVHNNVGEVWSLVSFLYPSLCARYYGSEDDPVAAAEECAKLLQHIMLRRTKGLIDLGIPPRLDEPTVMIRPSRVQQLLLARMTEEALSEDETSGTRLQAHLTHQRVVCNHPLTLRLLATEARASGTAGWEERLAVAGIGLNEASIITPSAKMVELDRMLRQFKTEGHRCLIFSNFTCVLDLLQALCVLRGYSFERLDGSTDRVERELSMVRFNAPGSGCFVFLLTTTAGGVGVTLTGADTVILFDAHYNPQIDRQAADRAHRIGQTRIVRVYRLCLSNTVEERILNVALRKASLGDFIVDGGSGGKGDDSSDVGLSSDRIRMLFGSAITAASNPSVAAVHSRPGEDHRDGNDTLEVNAETLAEDFMVEDLLRVEAEGLPDRSALKTESRGVRRVVGVTQLCFLCGEIMRPLEPLYHCSVCPKAYHPDCAGKRKLKAGVPGPRQWTCPRHSCVSCGKAQGVDGALFMCMECPLAFCFDCLDQRYFELDETKTQFLHISRTYPAMESEGMDVRRPIYYITCLRCCGVLSSSSSRSTSPSSFDGEESDVATENANDDGGRSSSVVIN